MKKLSHRELKRMFDAQGALLEKALDSNAAYKKAIQRMISWVLFGAVFVGVVCICLNYWLWG
jgi:hypothetical protein